MSQTVQEAAHERAILSKAMAWFCGKSLPGAFAAWRRAAARRGQHRALLERCLAALTQRSVHAAWSAWRSSLTWRRLKRQAMSRP